MSLIGSFFTNPERSYANWAMSLSLNDQINVELRFSESDPSEAKMAYLNIPAQPESSPDLSIEERTKIVGKRLAYFEKKAKEVAKEPVQLPISADPPKEPVESSVSKKEGKISPEKPKESAPVAKTEDLPKESIKRSLLKKIGKTSPEKPKESAPVSREEAVPKLFQSVEFVTYVKKFDISKLVYGTFWGSSNFEESSFLTRYFLVEGWLVVSNANDFLEMPSKIRNEYEVEIDPYDLQCQKYDALKQQLKKIKKAWFKFERQKLWTLLATSFASGLLFSAMVLAVRKSPDSVDKIKSKIFLMLCLFLQYVAINSGVTLYKLYELEFSVLHVDNVGLWVHELRILAAKHRDIVAKHPEVAKFFAPGEQNVLYGEVIYNFKA